MQKGLGSSSFITIHVTHGFRPEPCWHRCIVAPHTCISHTAPNVSAILHKGCSRGSTSTGNTLQQAQAAMNRHEKIIIGAS